MSKVLEPIAACFKKAETKEVPPSNDESKCDKKLLPSNSQPNLFWRMSSGIYSVGTGAVGLGVGSVKWAASATYNVGSGVVAATQTVVSKVVPSAVPKPKKE